MVFGCGVHADPDFGIRSRVADRVINQIREDLGDFERIDPDDRFPTIPFLEDRQIGIIGPIGFHEWFHDVR